MDCLDDPDDTLRLKTLDLLSRLTKANNVEVQPAVSSSTGKPFKMQLLTQPAFYCCVQVIVERMMLFLRSTTDEHLRRELVRLAGTTACWPQTADRLLTCRAWRCRS